MKAVIDDGKYVLFGGIAQGSYFNVKIGVEASSGKTLAIKLLNDDVGEEIMSEVAALMNMKNYPHII